MKQFFVERSTVLDIALPFVALPRRPASSYPYIHISEVPHEK